MPLKKHLFFCLNQKENGRQCCAQGNPEKLWAYAKQRLSELNLHNHDNFRVNKSGCLGRCSLGPTLVIYPDAVWYRVTATRDIDDIIEQHLLKGEVVARLLMVEPA